MTTLAAYIIIALSLGTLGVLYVMTRDWWKRRRCWPLDEHAKYYEDRS